MNTIKRDPVRVGIVGLGFMGTTHFGIYSDHAGAQVVAIADVDPAKRRGDIRAVVANIGGKQNTELDLNGLTVYCDAMELIADPRVDLVDICVPTDQHAQYTLAAITAGKHVLCEKPLARTASEAATVIAAAQASDRCFTAGMCVRAWPEYRCAFEQYKAGRYGRIRQAFFRRFSPNIVGNAWQNWFLDNHHSGGALLDLHLHDVDQILAFLGRPHRVTAAGLKGFRGETDLVDHVFAHYDFGDDIMVAAEGGWSAAKTAPFEMRFQLVCEQATVLFDHNGLTVHFEDGNKEQPDLSPYPHPTGWHAEIDALIDAIRTGRPADRYIPNLQDLVDGIRIVETERQSIDTGKTVTVNY